MSNKENYKLPVDHSSAIFLGHVIAKTKSIFAVAGCEIDEIKI
jgi:hypothetical protein